MPQPSGKTIGQIVFWAIAYCYIAAVGIGVFAGLIYQAVTNPNTVTIVLAVLSPAIASLVTAIAVLPFYLLFLGLGLIFAGLNALGIPIRLALWEADERTIKAGGFDAPPRA